MIEAEAYDRVIDPWTKKPVAAWGWLRRGNGLPDQYWVSIGDQSPQFFLEKTKAQQYFYANTHRLRAKVNQRQKREQRGIPRREKAHAL